MRILHVTKKYPNALGGDAVVVSNLAKQQQANGHQVTILTNNCADIVDDTNVIKVGLRDSSVGLDAITPKRLVSLVILFFSAFRIFKNVRPDIIHTHAVDMGAAISFAARWYHIPVVHTFHIITFYYAQQSLLRRKSELLLARIIAPALVTAPNEYDVLKLTKAGLRNVHLMPNGVDIAFWRRTRPADNTTFTFVSAGRLEEQKGYVYLIKAAILLRESHTNFKVVIVGEGSEKDRLEELARLGGALDYVTFAGRRTARQIHELYQSADAAVFPSLWETTPLTLLEAWAMQLPVILTRVGILQATTDYDESVLVIPPRDETSLLEAMQAISSSPKLRKRLVSSGTRHASTFAWEKVNGITESLYASVRSASQGANG